MLQAFTGVSKVEKAQRNLCQTSPSKNSDNKAKKTNRQQKMTKVKKVLDKETKLVYESASSKIMN
jgi:hypothetical protein